MIIEELIKRKNISKYRFAKDSGISYSTLNNICSGKTNISKCSSETIYKLAKALDVTMDFLINKIIEDSKNK